MKTLIGHCYLGQLLIIYLLLGWVPMIRYLLLFITIAMQILTLNKKSFSFDYLEHMYVTDRVCEHTVQQIERVLISKKIDHPNLLVRYLALSLFCPRAHPEIPYCREGFKLAEAPLISLSAPPIESQEYSLTLGDLSSLPDHIGRFGFTPQLARADKYGLTSMIIEWITSNSTGLTGTLYDIAEDACEGGNLVDWDGINQDIDRSIQRFDEQQELPQLPTEYLKARSRAPLQKGPSDPAALYSFDNPHYLDLVFRNHHHFGEKAYQAWLGFHQVGIDLAESDCASLIDPDPDWLEDLADDWTEFEAIDWEEYSRQDRQQKGCDLLSHILQKKVKIWSRKLPSEVINKLKRGYPSFSQFLDDKNTKESRELANAVLSATLSLIYEGSGLHFLQDSLAGGHMRTIRTRGGLKEARYDHDADNRDGVIASYNTAQKSHLFVAYGDAYLLGFGPHYTVTLKNDNNRPCPSSATPFSRYHGGRCALSVQRGFLTLATLGSLLDWSYGGLMYQDEQNISDKQLQRIYQKLTKMMPMSSPMTVKSHDDKAVATKRLGRANLPVPPPDFSYQVLSNRFAFDLAGSTPRLGLQLKLLDTLGAFAHWLSSYQFGLNVDLGEGDLNRWSLDAGYAFHFRWAARFTIDMGLSSHMGWKEFNTGIDWYVGITPMAGITLLPEGWIKMPLEFTVNYQLPLTFYDQGIGFPGVNLIDGHYFGIGLGLAFMK